MVDAHPAPDSVAVADAQGAQSSYPKVRRVRFRFGEDDSHGKYFIENDIVFSHFLANLSGAFPPGEEAFIRSVRRVADQIADPVLKKKVARFIGQESMHGQEHRRLNQELIEMGYKIDFPDRPSFIERRIRFERRLPARLHLAITAAAEHYTAVIAEHILSSDEIQAIPGAPEVWHLLNWHALEELEHKSVAFDVYRTVGGSERMRIAVMAMMIVLTLPLGILALTISLARDPFARRQPVRLVREAHRLFTGPMFDGLLPDLANYLRPKFHPDDIDTAGLLQRWQQELFGSQGALVDHLR
jgi:uncharacterized protein